MTENAKAIQATDLRIGNKINDCFGGMCEVRGITRRGIYIRDSSGPANESAFTGIPLTPEILLKCGFESIGHFTVMSSMVLKLERDRELSVGCVGTPNEMLFLKQEEDIIVIHNYDYDAKLYLHKLQNIVKSLTNKELEIKL